jgi:hypothetical protein
LAAEFPRFLNLSGAADILQQITVTGDQCALQRNGCTNERQSTPEIVTKTRVGSAAGWIRDTGNSPSPPATASVSTTE